MKKDTKEFLAEFREVISSEPRRTGKPKLVKPSEMKAIWDTRRRWKSARPSKTP